MKNATAQEILAVISVLLALTVFVTLMVFLVIPQGLDATFASDDSVIQEHKAWVAQNTTKDTEYYY